MIEIDTNIEQLSYSKHNYDETQLKVHEHGEENTFEIQCRQEERWKIEKAASLHGQRSKKKCNIHLYQKRNS